MRADEWLVDITAAEAGALRAPGAVRALCDQVIAAFDLTLVAEPLVHVFPGPGGITALYLLSESHLAIHTWPEKRGALLSLGTCRPGAPARFAWADVVRAHLGASAAVAVQHVPRALELHGGGAA